MDLYRAKKEAEDLQLHNRDNEIRFIMIFEKRTIIGYWLDPYLGLFGVIDNNGNKKDGFTKISDIANHEATIEHQWIV
jgi:hypothetical protein